MMEIADFYKAVCDCPNTPESCPNTLNQPKLGIPPRGFYTNGTRDSVQILIVGKNPGHVLDHEKDLYLKARSQNMAQAHLDFASQTFTTCNSVDAKKNRSLKFHRNLLRYFSYFLNVTPEEVFKHCAYTNVVKCQTIGEQDKLNKNTISTCLKSHFQRELDFFEPKLIVALGNEAHQALLRLNLSIPIHKLKHPSYHYKKENEAGILMGLKSEIEVVLET